jgi:hypothetical protein
MRILLSLLFVCFSLFLSGQKASFVRAVEPVVEVNDDFIKYFEGTVIIDDEISSIKALKELPTDRIESMEVYKGLEAREKFHIIHNQGVIEVKTKK